MRLERELLGPATGAAAAVGAVAAVVALAMGGGDALLASVVGSALVLGFLLLGQLPIALAARGWKGLGGFLLLFGYGGQVVVLLAALLIVLRTDVLDREPLGLSVIVASLGWTAAAVWTFMRWKPTLIEPLPPEERGEADRLAAEERRERRSDPR
jgi:hypothetical protein